MRNHYELVMDPNKNQLRGLPPAQKFQIMMYLSAMWTAIFCFAAGAWAWYGELLLGHIAVALGFLVTSVMFRSASRE
jgi:hypothetical protein